MWFRLAALWNCTRPEAMARCDSMEFAEWCAFYILDPWGGERGDLQAGIIASTIAQVNAAKGKRFKPADFMPKFGPRRGRQPSADEIQHELRSVCAALTGR
ncbi:MAG: DUF4035 domain-containing protein [Planctomycetes bacterium]|nr:DUF4035 domain-containing protein [Planctomycetota bacterium]